MRDEHTQKALAAVTEASRLAEIAAIIEHVDSRCMAADGPVTKTRHEITDDELRRIYRLAKGETLKRRRAAGIEKAGR